MATESESSQLSVRLPPDLESWLEELADERGMDRDRLLERLLEANQRALREEPEGETLSTQVDGLEDDFNEKIEDIRSRMLQLKRQTESKAPADHDHDEFDQFDGLEDQLTQIATTVSDLEADIEELATAVETHDETLETTQARLRRVAAAVVRMQRETHGDEERLTKLRDIAAQRGFETATCQACGNSVKISLLSEPVCPHCSTEFADITGKDGFFSTPKLVGGSSEQ